ncbi:MAG TPA: nucleotidyltransferase family protein, partial [Anaerovoracaceae bacterium]|nr:nucleotidyltransferase family protein [Anaerovoracaceae bacterium]
LEMGFSFPKSRYEAMKELKGSEKAEIIVDPNNILAVEYLKQWIRLKSHMQPMTIKRLGGGYHNKDSSVSMAGASAIRKKMALSLDVESVRHALPDTSADVMNRNIHQTIIDSEKLFPYLAYKVLTSDREYLSEIISSGEGLENRLKRAIIGSKSTEDIVRFILSKRYTETRVKRLLIHTLVSLKRKDFFRIIESHALYARVLGFSPKGAELIRYIKRERCSHIPIVTNINKELTKENPVWEILSYDILATDIYNLAHFGGIYQRSDYVLKPFFEECF